MKPTRLALVILGVAAALLLPLAQLPPQALSAQQERTVSRLADLMQENRKHLDLLIRLGYYDSLDRPLAQQDFKQMTYAAQDIARVAAQLREQHSQGEFFDETAIRLEEHATAVFITTVAGDLPETNVQLGKMAELCAQCHEHYRWK